MLVYTRIYDDEKTFKNYKNKGSNHDPAHTMWRRQCALRHVASYPPGMARDSFIIVLLIDLAVIGGKETMILSGFDFRFVPQQDNTLLWNSVPEAKFCQVV